MELALTLVNTCTWGPQLRCSSRHSGSHSNDSYFRLIIKVITQRRLSSLPLSSHSKPSSGSSDFFENALCRARKLLDWCLPQAVQTGVNVIFSTLFPFSNYVMPSGKVSAIQHSTLLHFTRYFCVKATLSLVNTNICEVSPTTTNEQGAAIHGTFSFLQANYK